MIVPTIGRTSLVTTLHSILNYNNCVAEIIVIDDSEHGLSQTMLESIQAINPEKIEIVRTGGLCGPSMARNLGLSLVRHEWIAFADDDDPWEPNRLDTQISIMLDENLLASVGVDGNNTSQQEVWNGDCSPLEYLYQQRGFRRHHRFIPIGSLVISRKVASLSKFDLQLKEREDLSFLEEIYSQGFSIRQLKLVCCYVEKNPLRSVLRSNVMTYQNWALRLYSLRPNLAYNFLIYIALRNYLFYFRLFRALGIARIIISLSFTQMRHSIFRDKS